MEKIIVVSKCLKSKRDSYLFHFKGVYAGSRIKSLVIYSDYSFEPGNNYILGLEVYEIRSGILVGRSVRQTGLDEARVFLH